jgi:hypothetical protein
MFELLADALNESGYDVKTVIKADVPWTKENVKECLWKPLQEAQLGKKSTTELTTKEIDQVYETLNRTLSGAGIRYVPFPSIQEILINQDIENYDTRNKI